MEEFIGLKIVAGIVYTIVVWFIGTKWTKYNSVSDIGALFTNAKSQLDTLKEKVAAEAKAAEAKAAELKGLIG